MLSYHNNGLHSLADFGMDDREMMRDASTFEEDIMQGATASNLLLEAEPGPANLPDKSNHMEYDDFGDASMVNNDGGMLGKQLPLSPSNLAVKFVLRAVHDKHFNK